MVKIQFEMISVAVYMHTRSEFLLDKAKANEGFFMQQFDKTLQRN